MSISLVTKFLEKVFDRLNIEYFENTLSKPVITIQSSPKTYGHFIASKIWKSKEEECCEINISAESLNRPIKNVIATMLHEMVHYYCSINKIQDTSRGHTYHNKRFQAEAEKRGLSITKADRIGWSVTTPTDKLIAFITSQKWTDIDINRKMIYQEKATKKKSSTRKYICPNCNASIRATKDVNLICADCSDIENENIVYFLKQETEEED